MTNRDKQAWRARVKRHLLESIPRYIVITAHLGPKTLCFALHLIRDFRRAIRGVR